MDRPPDPSSPRAREVANPLREDAVASSTTTASAHDADGKKPTSMPHHELPIRGRRPRAGLVTTGATHIWQFKARVRRHAFGWRSQPAI
jgi:hypothetical protein